MGNNAEIIYKDHYKLIIPFKDNIVLENELINGNIDYFKDEKSILYFRYYFLDIDRDKVDLILKKNEIFASLETFSINEFKEEKKLQSFYFKVVIVVILILIFIALLNY